MLPFPPPEARTFLDIGIMSIVNLNQPLVEWLSDKMKCHSAPGKGTSVLKIMNIMHANCKSFLPFSDYNQIYETGKGGYIFHSLFIWKVYFLSKEAHHITLVENTKM